MAVIVNSPFGALHANLITRGALALRSAALDLAVMLAPLRLALSADSGCPISVCRAAPCPSRGRGRTTQEVRVTAFCPLRETRRTASRKGAPRAGLTLRSLSPHTTVHSVEVRGAHREECGKGRNVLRAASRRGRMIGISETTNAWSAIAFATFANSSTEVRVCPCVTVGPPATGFLTRTVPAINFEASTHLKKTGWARVSDAPFDVASDRGKAPVAIGGHTHWPN
eukprot:3252970-Prymnesium_polylepis.1